MKKYVCNVCGWIYDPAVGIPEDGIPAGTAFEDLPEDWFGVVRGRDIYLEGVYLTSCLLCSKLRNFRTPQGDKVTVDAYGFCIDMFLVLSGIGMHTTYKSAWVFFVAYPCRVGNAKARDVG